MKRIVYCAIALAAITLFAACQKDGKFNPKEKIANVYEESFYTSSSSNDGQTYSDTSQTPKRLTERWTWDGNKLTQVVYIYYNQEWDGTSYTETTSEETVNFTYDGKQLTEANDGDERIVFTYDGKKLLKAEVYEVNETTPYSTLDFEHDGKKISKITLTEYDGIDWDVKGKPAVSRLERLLLSNMLPDMKPVENVIAKAKKSGAKASNGIVVELTWDGDNVSKMVVKEGAYNTTVTFTYDDKNNPYQGFLYILDCMLEDGPVFTNSNNIVKAVYNLSDYDGKGLSEENYTYTYDGKWPTSRTLTYRDGNDSYSFYYRETKYFEYK